MDGVPRSLHGICPLPASDLCGLSITDSQWVGCLVKPEVIGALTGNLGTRHGTQARGAVRRGAAGSENRGQVARWPVQPRQEQTTKCGDVRKEHSGVFS